MPGFGFSEKPTDTGWDVVRIAKAWAVLMQRLGYRRWVAPVIGALLCADLLGEQDDRKPFLGRYRHSGSCQRLPRTRSGALLVAGRSRTTRS
jgi:hypothetical protein